MCTADISGDISKGISKRIAQALSHIEEKSVSKQKQQECTATSLARVLEETGCPCPQGKSLEGLAAYLAMLMRWNHIMNLVGARSWQAAAKDLIADCLYLAEFLETLPLPASLVAWDPGAGAGLPGIPLRLVWQKGSYHMIEIRQKRALFISQALGTLSLPQTYVHNMDITAFMGDDAANRADLVVSRAFLPWEKVLALFADHLAPGGHVVFMANEIPEASLFATEAKGYVLADTHTYKSGSGTRCFFAAQRQGMPE